MSATLAAAAAEARMSVCIVDPWKGIGEETSFWGEATEASRRWMERARRRRRAPTWSILRQEYLRRNRFILQKAMMELRLKDNPDDADWEEEEEDQERSPDEEDLREMRSYRRSWTLCCGLNYGSFEDNTTFCPMRYTKGAAPIDARTEHVLEISSIQVTDIKDGLQWPLHVYGHVAVRDNVDNNRNLLFNRKRDNCQILTKQDSYLLLTGPSRPVMIIDPVMFEVDLKVRGETESEDKILSLKVFPKRRDDMNLGHCPSNRSTVHFAFSVVFEAVAATVDSVKVISGSWPDHLPGRVVCRTASIAQKDIVLLDSRYGRMPITSDGQIELSRRVVAGEVGGELTICVEATEVGEKNVGVEGEVVSFKTRKSGCSRATCHLGFCVVEINVSWSLFTITKDQHSRMKSVILGNLGKASSVETEGARHRMERAGRRRWTPAWSRLRQAYLRRNKFILQKAMMELRLKGPDDADWEEEEEEEEDFVRERSPEEEKDFVRERSPEEEDDLREMRSYRRNWILCKGLNHGSFEDNTTFCSMRYTKGAVPIDARSEMVLEIFSIQVTEIKDGLQWPLHVYGHVAVRGIVDHNRNLLFNRKRDNCQILTQQDSNLLLVGPSRPVMIIEPVAFEVDLKVRGETESEDKILSLKVFHKRHDDMNLGRCSSNRSTVDFAFSVVYDAVEATVESVKVISGSWPDHLRGRVVCRTAQKDIVLLDSRYGRMPITSDGQVELSRRVVAGEVGGGLTICVEATEVGDKNVFVDGKVNFKTLKAGCSRATCPLGFCVVEINVAWSLFTIQKDQHSRMKSVILGNLGKASSPLDFVCV
ncbi:hypothetical protein EJB05_31862 [Eragrostis curvula]|uniref:DUF6598 domain-containing protein n=1 Tax=Eragrostis curvula TaxID=38414 RepID=A0A5J9UG38_9POAL|nr:hypothetical protein EJB05_31862 [Eragrostis curvula]